LVTKNDEKSANWVANLPCSDEKRCNCFLFLVQRGHSATPFWQPEAALYTPRLLIYITTDNPAELAFLIASMNSQLVENE
jgi:hypothetical protein